MGGTLNAMDATIVSRTPLAGDGKSGSRLERVELADGTVVIEKSVAPSRDWLSRALHDEGRAVSLWTRGILQRVPPVVDHAVLDAWPTPEGGVIRMRDVSAQLITEDRPLSRAGSRRILEAAAALHEAFLGEELAGLCALEDRYTMLSPATAERERDGTDVAPKVIGRGWEIFADVVAADVAEAVLELAARPAPLVAALAATETTLIQGDLKFGNLGLAPDRVIFLDWGTQTGVAPPAVEFAWYLVINGARIDAPREAVLDDVRAVSGDRHDERALDLALLGALVQLGFNKAYDAVESGDDAVRAREQADLDWWVATGRRVLDAWSPT
jgi:hypothetical protein